jgi:nucleoid-associated protein YgaU
MNKFRALLMGFAATVGAGGIAAYNGVFDRTELPAQGIVTQPATEAPKAETPSAEVPAAEAPKVETDPAQDVSKAVTEPEPVAPAATPAETQPAAETPTLAAPSFDILRVEPDGSVLIAGKAGENAQVEVLSGADVLGVAKAQANGDFAITLADPLKPGDYQLVLRATGDDGKSANSAETATVSVPEQKDGPVLALVEEAGKPSRIITAPEIPQETAQVETPAAEANQPATAEMQVSGEVKAPEEPAAPAASSEAVAIEAVETEEGKIFIAGSAKGVATVRIYANDQVLGDAKPDAGDRFLGEFQKELAPGDYIFKAEGLAADGVTVISRATVPFQQQAAQAESAAPAAPAETAQADDSTAAAEQAAPAAKPMAVIIRRGDTLWQISRRIYGRGVRYSTIYLANEGVTGDPNRIFPGQVFKVPEKTPEGEAADALEVEKRAAPDEIPAQ